MSTPDHAPSSAPFYILDADAPLLPDEEPVPPTRRRGETFAVKPAARRTPLPAFTQAAHDAGLHLLVRPAHAPPLAALLAAEGGPS